MQKRRIKQGQDFSGKWLACGDMRDESFRRWRHFHYWYVCNVFWFQISTGFFRLIGWQTSTYWMLEWLIDFDRFQIWNWQNSARKNGQISGTTTTANNLELENGNRLNDAHSSAGKFSMYSRPNHGCLNDWLADWLMNWRIENCLFYLLSFSNF